MNDREFIELLNLYVDHEISAEDALRLEAEVGADRSRREIYNQYCRIQKACTMLSGETAGSVAAEASPNVIDFPLQRRRSLGPVFAGLAAAAAIAVAFVDLRSPAKVKPLGLAASAPEAVHISPVAAAVYSQAPADSMKPVFLIGREPGRSALGRQEALFSSVDTSSQMVQLNWIGDVRMTPVFSSAGNDFLLNPRTDIKAAVLADPQDNRDDLQPVEMTAFRFQR